VRSVYTVRLTKPPSRMLAVRFSLLS